MCMRGGKRDAAQQRPRTDVDDGDRAGDLRAERAAFVDEAPLFPALVRDRPRSFVLPAAPPVRRADRPPDTLPAALLDTLPATLPLARCLASARARCAARRCSVSSAVNACVDGAQRVSAVRARGRGARRGAWKVHLPLMCC